MRVRSQIAFFCILIAILILSSAQRERDLSKDELVRQGVEIRLEAFRERKRNECRDKAIMRAVVMADSLIRIRVLEIKGLIDDSAKPAKPRRPDQKKIKDSLQLQPLFDKDRPVSPTDTLIQ